MPDFLTPYQTRRRPLDEAAMIDDAADEGRAQAYRDLGYVAPKRGGIEEEDFPAMTRPAVRGVKAPNTDPFKNPDYLAMERFRGELAQNEALHRQRLKDFDETEGAVLKWRPDTQQGLQDRGIAAINARDFVRPSDALPFRIQEMARTDPTNPALVGMNRQYQLLSERRARLEAEANRVAEARRKFDQDVFIPQRDSMIGPLRSQSVMQQETPDYLAPTEGPWAGRISDINASRRARGEAPIRPGSVAADVPWGQIRPAAQEPDEDGAAPELGGDEPLDQGGPPNRFASVADDFRQEMAPTDYLSLPDQWKKAGPLERLKMMFGSRGYGQNEPEAAKPMIGSEAAGVEGGAFTIPKMQGDGAMAGVINAANKFTSGMTTPENVGLLAATGGGAGLARMGAGTVIGDAARVAGAGALAGFTGVGARDTIEGVGRAVEAARDPRATRADVADALTGAALSGAMTGAGALGLREFMPQRPRNGTPPAAPGEPRTPASGRGVEIDPDFLNELGGATEPALNVAFDETPPARNGIPTPPTEIKSAMESAETFGGANVRERENIPPPSRSAQDSAQAFLEQDFREAAYRDNPLWADPERYAQELRQKIGESDEAWNARVRDLEVEAERAGRADVFETALANAERLAQSPQGATALRDSLSALGESNAELMAQRRAAEAEAANARAERATATEAELANAERMRRSRSGADTLADDLAAQRDNAGQPTGAEASAEAFRDTEAQRNLRQSPAGGEALRGDLSAQASVDPERRAYLEPAIGEAANGGGYKYTVFRVGDPAVRDPIQVDVFDRSGRNLASSSPEELRAMGVDLPDVPDHVGQGQYSVEQIRQAANKPQEVANATDTLGIKQGAGEELSRTAPREDVSENGPQIRDGEGASANGGDRPLDPAQGQGDAGLSGGGEPPQVVGSTAAEPTVSFGGTEYRRSGDGQWTRTSDGTPALEGLAKILDRRASENWSDRAIQALENLKFNKPRQVSGNTPLSLAWDAAVETAIVGIKAGRKVAEVVREAVERFRGAHPEATDADVARLSQSIQALAAGREASVAAPAPKGGSVRGADNSDGKEANVAAPAPKGGSVRSLPETVRQANPDMPLESQPYDRFSEAAQRKEAAAFIAKHGAAEAERLVMEGNGDITSGPNMRVLVEGIKRRNNEWREAKTPAEKQAALERATAFISAVSKRATEKGRETQAWNDILRDPYSADTMIALAENSVAKKRNQIIGEQGVKVASEAAEAVNKINAEAAPKVAESVPVDVKLTKGSAEKVGAKLKKGAPDLDKQIKTAMKDLEVKVRDVIKEHYSVVDSTGQTLAQKLVDEAGLTGAEADALAAKVKKRFAEMTDAAKRAELDRRFKAAQNVGAKTVLRRTLTDKLIEQSNLGGMSGERFLNASAKELKLPSLNVEQAARLADLADKIQKAPEGFKRNELITEALTELRKIEGVGKTDIATAIYYAHILSGPTTQAVNTVSTAINTAFDLGALALTNPGKVGHIINGALDGVGEGLRQAGRTLKTGVSDKGLTTKTGGGKGEGLNASPVLEIVAKDPEANKAVRGYAKALRHVGRLMSASDAVFYETNKAAYDYVAAAKLAEMANEGNMTRQQLNRKIRDLLATSPFEFESARQQAAKEGFTDREAAFRTAEIMRQKRAQRLGSADAEGKQFALNATFNEKPRGVLGLVSEKVAETAEQYPALKLFVPFTRIVANVANANLNYSPVGLGRAIRGTDSFTRPNAGRLSPVERQQMYVKGVAGTIGTVAGIAWALNQGDPKKQPLLTGRGPADPNARNQLRETGWMPYSVKIGDRYYSYLNTPMMLPAAVIGNLADKVHYDKITNKSAGDALARSLTTLPETLTNMTFLQGLAQMAQIMRGGPEGESAIRQFAQNTAGAVVPNAVQQIDRAFDGTVRETGSDVGTVAGRIPGLREQLPARLNVRAQPVRQSLMDRFTRPTQGDETAQYVAQTQNWIPGADRPMLGPPGQKRQATDSEYRDFQRIRGEQINSQLASLLPQIRQLPPEAAGKVIDRIAAQATANARVQLELRSREIARSK